MKRTKIICTMGPATESEEVLRELIKAGMNVARFNFSHGTHEYHKQNIERVRRVSKELGANVAIMLDTKGPEIRTRLLEDGKNIFLETGSTIDVTTEDIVGNKNIISLDYEKLPREVSKGSRILIDDGLIELEVESVEGPVMHCRVVSGGELGEHKGVNVPNVDVSLSSVTPQDKEDIKFGCELGIDALAASFIRNAEAVEEVRNLCRSFGCKRVSVYAKIESAFGVQNMDEIIDAASGIMVARGDLGVEIPAAQVPHIQKAIIRKCNHVYKPVITATQMLDSMIRNPRPTRAEVTDVANAILDGTDCVMLSGETAAGNFPVEAVKMMASICEETEQYLEVRRDYYDRGGIRNINGSIAFAAVTTAENCGANCIIAPTSTGRTARIVADFRPNLPIYAMSPSEITVRKCSFYWGVTAFLSTMQDTLSATLYSSLDLAKEHNLVKRGDLAVVTAGDPCTSAVLGDYITSTNLMMVAQIQ